MPDHAPTDKVQPPLRVSDWVASRILDQIARGELVPGQRLPGERQLAEQLNVSRVSVRAALQRLKTQGFLSAVQGGGTRVVSSAGAMDGALTELVRSNLDNLFDLAEIRLAIEVRAAERAALRCGPEHLAQMAETLEAMRTATDGGALAALDVEFHMAIARASGSSVYLHLLATVRDILAHTVAIHHSLPFIQSPEGEDVLLAQHSAIFEAIRRGDAAEAAAAVTRHLTFVLDRYREMRAAP